LENNFPNDLLEFHKKARVGYRIWGTLIFVGCLIATFYENSTKGIDVLWSIGMVAIGVFGFLGLWYLPDRQIIKRHPKKVRWNEMGVELKWERKRRLIPWKDIYDIVEDPVFSVYGISLGVTGYTINEEIGKKLEKAWERWQDEQAEIKAREWEEKKNRKARKKWWM
jgi:hypothetical protein